ncbi:hypothetical protein TNIN_420681 [Trichonephila inaurata madagascariensis]|uniref:Uncharacterized protein n=1 Tax=Trichonephila inaurata madagascariensis TaxID=2747483 RepID=A0A8X6XCR0_9ARAC|nr:hypothetical protein TNIN_420681 [Trichonephila inaurata madagascariensis]
MKKILRQLKLVPVKHLQALSVVMMKKSHKNSKKLCSNYNPISSDEEENFSVNEASTSQTFTRPISSDDEKISHKEQKFSDEEENSSATEASTCQTLTNPTSNEQNPIIPRSCYVVITNPISSDEENSSATEASTSQTFTSRISSDDEKNS